MYILLTGVSHRTASVNIREYFAFSPTELEKAYSELKDNPYLEGVVILSTCNRTEIYASTRDLEAGQMVLKNFFTRHSGLPEDSLNAYLYQCSCFEAIDHLFRVVSGLDSMILGETQILGQVKDSYEAARKVQASNGVLNQLFQRSLHVGKKVRSQTAIDQHPVSVSYAAVTLAQQVLGPLDDKSVMIVGAGEMGELATRYLMDRGVHSVIVSNRSYDKACEMAACLNGRAVQFDKLAEELLTTDIVISCTAASHYVIRGERCRDQLLARQGKAILMIDIAVPRDIDPSLKDVKGVYLYDIDSLQHVVDESYEERKAAAVMAEEIIVRELEEFNSWLATLYVVPIITAMKRFGENVKQRELKRAFNRLGKVTEREQRVITEMASAIVNQLLRGPVKNLKELAPTSQGHMYAELSKQLFGLNEDKEQTSYEQYTSGHQG